MEAKDRTVAAALEAIRKGQPLTYILGFVFSEGYAYGKEEPADDPEGFVEVEEPKEFPLLEKTLRGPAPWEVARDAYEERKNRIIEITNEHRACETAPNGTGEQCLCSYDCANYWLRAHGFRA